MSDHDVQIFIKLIYRYYIILISGYRLKEYGDIIRLKDYIEAFDIASLYIEKKCPGVNTQNQYNPCITRNLCVFIST